MTRLSERLMTSKVRLVLIVLVAVLGTSGAASALSANDSDDTLLIVAKFSDASPLLVGSDVKVSGVRVGQTVSMNVVNGIAHVGLELEPTALPVYRDARATIRPVSLLGERFVDLDRGSPDQPVLSDGDVIGTSRTGQNVDLDQVLNALDNSTSASLEALITTLGAGMEGNGKNLDAAVRKLAPAMAHTDRLVRVLHEQNSLLNNVIDDAVPVAKALAKDNGSAMDELMSSADKLLATTARQQRQFDQSLAEMPETLRVVRSTLNELTAAANQTTPTLAALRPTTDSLSVMSQELHGFSTSADRALTSADPLLGKATTMVEQARPVVAVLRRSGPDMNAVTKAGAPLARELSVHFEDVMMALRNWALTTNGRDGLSHYFRGLAVVSPESFAGLLPSQPEENPGPILKPKPTLPALPKLPGLGVDGKPLEGLLAPSSSPDGSVTGLSREQENGLAGLILGGN